MKTFLFINPASGHYSNRHFSYVMEQLAVGGIRPTVFQVRSPADILTHCNASITRVGEPHLVIVAGGDGTFNAVINALEPGTSTLAVLPFGTSNVLAAELGITSIEDGVARILANTTRSISVGVLEMQYRTLRFVLMAGIGFDGAVVRDVWPLGKKLLRQGAYALSALKNALFWDDKQFEVSSSGSAATCHTAIICNASRYGGNFILSPGTSPFQAGLTTVCVTGAARRDYVKSIWKLFRGTSESDANLPRFRTSTLEIHGIRPIQIDGDFVGYSPARIYEHIDFARIIV